MCAQRLSASKEYSPCSGIKPFIRAHWCSTPLGIKGILTRAGERSVRRPRNVLNASRHQRNTHRSGITPAAPALPSAQRLSASKEYSLGRFGKRLVSSKIPGGAQRLSASKEYSLREKFFAGAFALCSTPLGIKGILTLNRKVTPNQANGAQRLSASKEYSPPGGTQHRSWCCVLNASRHQRNTHFPSLSIPVHAATCSTPLGIKGILT
jgi:hypothetical protein